MESAGPFGGSSHEQAQIRRQSVSSLTRLEIECCDLLRVLPGGLIPSGPCYVCVRGCGCADLKIEFQQ